MYYTDMRIQILGLYIVSHIAMGLYDLAWVSKYKFADSYFPPFKERQNACKYLMSRDNCMVKLYGARVVCVLLLVGM